MPVLGSDHGVACRAVAATIASAIVLLAVGCGDGGDEASAEKQPRGVSLSRTEFIAEASKGCRQARSELKQEVTRFLATERGEKPRPVLYADLAHFVILPAVEAEMEAIRDLGVPPSEKERIEDILDDAEYTINIIVFEQRIPSVDAIYQELGPVSKGFRAYGLPACANGTAVTSGS